MADKNQTPKPAPIVAEQNGPELLEIGELRSKHKIGRAVFAGVCAAQGWKPGKKITEGEFARAVSEFTGAAMGGSHQPDTKRESEGKV